MNLPVLQPCEYRVPGEKDTHQCLHPRVLAPKHQVTTKQCSKCNTWQIKEPPRKLDDPAPLAPDDTLSKRQKYARWLLAVARYWEHGSPKATEEEYQQRLSICHSCELCIDDHCTHPRCGCRLKGKRPLRNKLRMATEACPIGHWPSIKREGSKRKKKLAMVFRALAQKLQNTADR